MKIFRVLAGLILVFSLAFTIFIGKEKIDKGHDFGRAEEYKGILTVWQIDTFEGGVGSRKQFLMKIARSFEKQNQGVLIMVTEHTIESAEESIKKGEFPDMISYGAGVSVNGLNKLNLKKTFVGGMLGKESYAIPWCRGGYVLIKNPKLKNDGKALLVSQAQFTEPLTAYFLEGFTAENVIVKPPMEAYIEFTLGKTPLFLGTQRDIIRLERRGIEVECQPLTKFNDLYQYISVIATDGLKRSYSEKFIDYLLQEKNQKKLSEIGMASLFTAVEYDNIHLTELQKIKYESTVSVFLDKAKLLKMQELSLSALQGNETDRIKLKNMLV